MTGDDRLRAELEALERTAPADLPPLRSETRRAASWRPVAPVATVALAAVLVLVVAPRWLGPLAPSPSPSTSGRHSAETSASAAPSSPPGMAWHVVSVDEPGAIFSRISQVEGRLILGGSLLGRPQAWWSDDGGGTWQRSSQDGAEALGGGSLGQVVGTHDRLLSFGTRMVGANDSKVLPEIWISDDFGEHWRASDPQGIPPSTVEIAWNGSRFLAFTDTSAIAGAIDYVSNSIGIWTSADGQAWEQVAGTDAFGLSVAIIDVAQANDMTALALAGADGTGELWLSDDGASWERSEGRSGIAVRPEALGSTLDDLVVVETKELSAGSLARDLLRSTDGRSWTATPLNLEHQPPVESSQVSTITPGPSGTLLTGYTGQVRGGAGQLSWYLPEGADEARLLDIGIVDAAAVGDGFVGIYTCGPLADCDIALVYGLPAGQTPPQPTVGTPDPTPSETFDDDPAEVTGVLRGDQEQGIGCIWLTDAQGNRWEIIWPEGYYHEFVDGIPTLMRDGEVMASAGDTITLTGARSRDLGSVCMVGIVYEATQVRVGR